MSVRTFGNSTTSSGSSTLLRRTSIRCQSYTMSGEPACSAVFEDVRFATGLPRLRPLGSTCSIQGTTRHREADDEGDRGDGERRERPG